MTYKLTIVKYEKNPKYSPKQTSYNYSEQPEFLTYEEALIVTLTDEEFSAIKKAVIEVIK